MSFTAIETGGILPDDTAIITAKRLGLGTNRDYRQWGKAGEVYLDFSPDVESRIDNTILRSTEAALAILNGVLVYESDNSAG